MSDNKRNVAIADLIPGMFIDSIVKQKGSYAIKTRGVVRTQSTIENLRNAGILELLIDEALSSYQTEEEPETVTPVEEQAEPENAPDSLQNLSAARKIYGEAKSIQSKLFEGIKAGKAIDLEPVRQLSQALMDEVFNCNDALQLISQLRNKNHYLLEHSINNAMLMTAFAKQMKFDKQCIEELAMGALLCDIGMVHVPDHIINKQGRISEAEKAIIEQHVAQGWEMAGSIPDIPSVTLDVISLHHERLDGSGYPRQLKGEDISIYGRMIAIVDSYEALTSDRHHKSGVSPMTAFKILKSGCSRTYDEELVSEFIRCVGIYPLGSLVKLKSDKLAMVHDVSRNLTKPRVIVFYNIRHRHYIPVTPVDLADPKQSDEVVSAVRPTEFGIDLAHFITSVLM